MPNKNQDENKKRNRKFHGFIHYISGLIGPLCICPFSLSNTFIFDPKKEYQYFRLRHKQAITCTHLCTRLKYLKVAFFGTSKIDSRPVLFRTTRRYAIKYCKVGVFLGSFTKFLLQLFFSKY